MSLADKPTGDLLVLMIAGTICFTVVASGAAVTFVEVFHPERDTDPVVGALRDTINTLIGLLAGYLAGRSRAQARSAEQGSHLPPEVGGEGRRNGEL